MEKLEELLRRWRAIEPQQVSVRKTKVDPIFQPRETRLAPYRDRGRLEADSLRHVEDLAAKLDDGVDLEPILVGHLNGAQWLIDGHHRLQAYRRQQRSHIPARVLEVSWNEAIAASKAANCDGVKLPMHLEQKREAAWQYLAITTGQGRQALPEGLSLRSIGRTFGVGRSTLSRMHQRLPGINREEFLPAACDPGTDWPQWKHVKGNAIRDRFGEVTDDMQVTQLAAKLATLLAKNGTEVFLKAFSALESEALSEAAERLAEATNDGAEDY